MTIKNIISSTLTAGLLLASTVFADSKSDIVGKWKDSEGVETIEYKADGSMIETMAGSDVIKGKYSFVDATHIKAEVEGPMAAMGPIVSQVVIKGDTMTVTEADGQTVMQYTKVKE